jgi:hypothetical protein
MTIAPEALEELDFPTPQIEAPPADGVHPASSALDHWAWLPEPLPVEPMERLASLVTGLVETLMEILGLDSDAMAQFIEDATQMLNDDDNSQPGYCWCSPSRTMLGFGR